MVFYKNTVVYVAEDEKVIGVIALMDIPGEHARNR